MSRLKKNASINDINEIASEIEGLDLRVENQDRETFDTILNSYLVKVDPNNSVSIAEAVIKMGLIEANKLLNELLVLHYEDEI